MKNRIVKINIVGLFLLFQIGFIACNEFEEPPTIYNPDQIYTTSPVITSIIPAEKALAGVREITILGENFAVNGIDTNWIFIGGKAAVVKSIEANKIVVYRPLGYGDDLVVDVVIPTSPGIAKVENYDIEIPVDEFGDFNNIKYQNDLTIMTLDSEENLYVGTRKTILKLSADGIFLTEALSDLPSTFNTFTDLKFGPDGFLYVLTGRTQFYRFDLNTGEYIEYYNFSKRQERFDFDEKGNIYAGRRDGVYMLSTEGVESFTGYYDDFRIQEIRVFNGYLYVAAIKTLSRNQILEDGTLGEIETLIDVETIPDLSSTELTSMNMDAEGMLMVCLDNHSDYSLFVLEDGGSLTPYYKSPILPATIDQVVFGNDRYLYLNRGLSVPFDSVRVYKMGMENLGAPNLGIN